MKVQVTHWTLETSKPARQFQSDKIDTREVLLPNASLNRFFYVGVGSDWLWYAKRSWSYDQWVETETDELGNDQEYKDDAYDRLVSVVEHNDGSEYTTNYTWRADDLLIGIEDAEDLAVFTPSFSRTEYDFTIRGIGRHWRGLGGGPGVLLRGGTMTPVVSLCSWAMTN